MDVIDNKYRVLRTLGKGGCGTVYVCWSEALNCQVAVKVSQERLDDTVGAKRFRAEAQALSLCRHEYIVQVKAFGVTEDGHPYFVMDYIEGHSLAEEIKEKGILSPPRFLSIFSNLLQALQCAHDAGLIHRDLKPSNIMLTEIDGVERAVLIDFGVTKRVDAQKLTATDALLGTPYYMSPEQCNGTQVDARSDLYSLGCTMYEAASGHPPFAGEPFQVLLSHLNDHPQNIPQQLEAFLDKAMAKDRQQRFADANAMRSYLHTLNLEQRAAWKAPLRARSAGGTGKKGSHAKRLVPLLTVLLIMIVSGWFISTHHFNLSAPFPNQADKLTREQLPDAVRAALNECNAQEYLIRTGKAPWSSLITATEKALAELDSAGLGTSRHAIDPIRQRLMAANASHARHGNELEIAEKGLSIGQRIGNQQAVEREMNLLAAQFRGEEGDIAGSKAALERACELAQAEPPTIPGRAAPFMCYLHYLRQHHNADREQMFSLAKSAIEAIDAARSQGTKLDPLMERQCYDNMIHVLPLERHPEYAMLTAAKLKKLAESDQLDSTWEFRDPSQAADLKEHKIILLAYAAGCLARIGKRSEAEKLWQEAQQASARDERKPCTGGAFAVHTMLDANLPEDRAERTKLARIHYDQFFKERVTRCDSFIACASHLANALAEESKYGEAHAVYVEGIDVADRRARQIGDSDVNARDRALLMELAMLARDVGIFTVLKDSKNRQSVLEECHHVRNRISKTHQGEADALIQRVSN